MLPPGRPLPRPGSPRRAPAPGAACRRLPSWRPIPGSVTAQRPVARDRYPVPHRTSRHAGGWACRPLTLSRFEVLTFDCYGTLIDWEAGIAAGLRAVLGPRGIDVGDEDLLERYARHEAAVEAGPYAPYREVLARSLRGVCAELGVEPTGGGGGGLRRICWRLAGLRGLAGRPGPPRVPLPPGRHHELRRRPVRGVEPSAGSDVRLGDHRPAGRQLQAERAQLRGRLRADRRPARAGSSTSPRASSTTTCRRSGWA